MKSARALIGADLKWIQPAAFKREFELCAGDQLVATLRFRGSFDSLAYTESTDGCWVFQRGQGWGAPASVAECDSREPIALLHRSWLKAGGTVQVQNGPRFFISANFTATEYRVTTEANNLLLRFKTAGLLHLSAHLEILPTAVNCAELSWLIPFSWYVWLLGNMDAARNPLRRNWLWR